tara:strand:- start:232 stop:663 length:432 start_codon:yes stop_codon:yes gene_type:complete
MTAQELANELGQLGEALSDPQELLSELGDDIVARMKANVPVDTGRLRSSIRWGFNGVNAIEFFMLEYGTYQNYGVLPNYNTSSYHKPFANEFGTYKQPIDNPEGIYGMYKNRAFGLPSRQFYDELQITDFIGSQFLEEITVEF